MYDIPEQGVMQGFLDTNVEALNRRRRVILQVDETAIV